MSKTTIKKLLGQAHKVVAIYNETVACGDQNYKIETTDTTDPTAEPYVRVIFEDTYSLGYQFLEPLVQYCIRFKITFSIGKLGDRDAYYVDIS